MATKRFELGKTIDFDGFFQKYAIGDDNDHLIWVKWITPENKAGEWAAESQSIFETPEQIAIIDEIKAKKEIWPWVEDENDGTIELRKSLLKQGGKTGVVVLPGTP